MQQEKITKFRFDENFTWPSNNTLLPKPKTKNKKRKKKNKERKRKMIATRIYIIIIIIIFFFFAQGVEYFPWAFYMI